MQLACLSLILHWALLYFTDFDCWTFGFVLCKPHGISISTLTCVNNNNTSMSNIYTYSSGILCEVLAQYYTYEPSRNEACWWRFCISSALTHENMTQNAVYLYPELAVTSCKAGNTSKTSQNNSPEPVGAIYTHIYVFWSGLKFLVGVDAPVRRPTWPT